MSGPGLRVGRSSASGLRLPQLGRRNSYTKRTQACARSLFPASRPRHSTIQPPQPTDRRDVRGALTMTPCDLFAQIKGRTLWIIGDSMSKDLIKVGGG